MSEAIFPRTGRGDGDWRSGPLGRVVSVSGGQAVILLDAGPEAPAPDRPPGIGSLIAVGGAGAIVLAQVSALSTPMPSPNGEESELKLVEVDLVGELPRDEDGAPGAFRRGVSVHPALGDPAHAVTRAELARAHAGDGHDAIRIGTLGQDPSIPAMVRLDGLLGRPFAIFGESDTDRSGAVAVIAQRLIDMAPGARVVLLDRRGAYAGCFGERAETVTARTLSLPFWLLDADELAAIAGANHADRDILRALLPTARRRHAAAAGMDLAAHEIGADTPVPYRIDDLIGAIDETGNGDAPAPSRLGARLEAVASDPRLAFMFADAAAEDTEADCLGRLFRMPADGRPVSIVALDGLPGAVGDVVVAALARLALALGRWSDVPLLLVCEEAHRYVPGDAASGFAPAGRAIARIAAEGAGHGVSLGLVSRRPGALDPAVLSQCGTVFALRLAGQPDRDTLRAGVADASGGLFGLVSTLRDGEAVALGDGIGLPARIRFDPLGESAPQNPGDAPAKRWTQPPAGDASIPAILRRWRGQDRR